MNGGFRPQLLDPGDQARRPHSDRQRTWESPSAGRSCRRRPRANTRHPPALLRRRAWRATIRAGCAPCPGRAGLEARSGRWACRRRRALALRQYRRPALDPSPGGPQATLERPDLDGAADRSGRPAGGLPRRRAAPARTARRFRVLTSRCCSFSALWPAPRSWLTWQCSRPARFAGGGGSLALLVGITLLASASIAAVWLWFDVRMMPVLDHYSLSGWYLVVVPGIQAVGVARS